MGSEAVSSQLACSLALVTKLAMRPTMERGTEMQKFEGFEWNACKIEYSCFSIFVAFSSPFRLLLTFY